MVRSEFLTHSDITHILGHSFSSYAFPNLRTPSDNLPKTTNRGAVEFCATQTPSTATTAPDSCSSSSRCHGNGPARVPLPFHQRAPLTTVTNTHQSEILAKATAALQQKGLFPPARRTPAAGGKKWLPRVHRIDHDHATNFTQDKIPVRFKRGRQRDVVLLYRGGEGSPLPTW